MIFLIDELGEENCQEYKQHVHRAITSSGKKSKVFTTLSILWGKIVCYIVPN